MDLAAVLEHATQPGLLKSKLPLDHAERVLDLCADVGFGGLDQIIQSSLGCIGQSPSLSWSDGNTEADTLAFHFRSLLNLLIASVGVDDCLLTVQ